MWLIVEISESSGGRYTPEDIEYRWSRDDLNQIIARREIKSMEMLIDEDPKAATARKEKQTKINRLHERMLKQLNTETFADRMKGETSEKSDLKEAIRQHNATLPSNKLTN